MKRLIDLNAVCFLLLILLVACTSSSSGPTATSIPSAIPAEPTNTVAPLGFSGNPVLRNSDWEPTVEEKNGFEMALVPAGCFMMGSESGNEDEMPANEQCFSEPFWIDVYEVTNEAYGREVAGNEMDLPVSYVNWFDAAAFCQNRGERLPTEAEWEYAARGPDGLKYTWRSENFGSAFLVYFVTPYVPFPVGSKPPGVSWVGAFDMLGNVWEWTNSIYQPYPFDPEDGREADSESDSSRVRRGGAYITRNEDQLRTAYRRGTPPAESNQTSGFRCASSY